jgi:hypothetical protein
LSSRALLELPPTGAQIGEIVHRAEATVDRGSELDTRERLAALEAETTEVVDAAIAQGIIEPAGSMYQNMGTLYRFASGGRGRLEQALRNAEAKGASRARVSPSLPSSNS